MIKNSPFLFAKEIVQNVGKYFALMVLVEIKRVTPNSSTVRIIPDMLLCIFINPGMISF